MQDLLNTITGISAITHWLPLAELGFIYGLRLFKIVIQFGGVSKCPARLK